MKTQATQVAATAVVATVSTNPMQKRKLETRALGTIVLAVSMSLTTACLSPGRKPSISNEGDVVATSGIQVSRPRKNILMEAFNLSQQVSGLLRKRTLTFLAEALSPARSPVFLHLFHPFLVRVL